MILQCLCQLSLRALYTFFSLNVKDILKIAMDAKAFWIHCIDADKKEKNELDLNKRKLAAVVLSVLLRKQLYLTWSKMSHWCLHREEINAMEATWLLGNENPKYKRGVQRRRRRIQCWENYSEMVLIFCSPIPHMYAHNTCVLETSVLSDSIAPTFRGS